jgi:Fe-S-cluster containining protein
LAQDANEERCPLLHQGVCLLYEARPIICRTHGYPLLTELDGKGTLDHCPLNFKEITNFPAKTIINMDIVNITLAAINSVFCTSDSISLSIGRERLTIAQALLLDL